MSNPFIPILVLAAFGSIFTIGQTLFSASWRDRFISAQITGGLLWLYITLHAMAS